ncbi:MAG: hypothetical protein R2912_03590 [Eubacteriales bacterium]
MLKNAEGTLVDTFNSGSLTPDTTSGRIESDPTIARVFFQNPTRGERTTRTSPRAFRRSRCFPIFRCITPARSSSRFAATTRTRRFILRPTETSLHLILRAIPSRSRSRKTRALRAVSYVSGKRISEITTATYLFEKRKHTVPVVCVTRNPARVREVMRVNDKDDKVERLAYILLRAGWFARRFVPRGH